ncbi:MAG: 6-phosphofructokinase [Bacteroidetes bacterium]|nr:6-phosphofructokinase [Bacteroidota bacterium]
MKKIRKIAVFTSGGDAPGMNACIRAVVRTALYNKLEVVGIRYGYEGMIDGDFISLNAKSVSNIIQRGGTILKTARSKRFMTKEGMQQAFAQLRKHKVDAIVAIGGDGTFSGAKEFQKLCKIPIVGCPGTIDNDLVGTDYAIGYDTAINTVLEAVDKIRDTAESHNRLFLVEVMGRDAGLIALRSGIGVGAEAVMVPETKNDMKNVFARLQKSRADKSSKIIVIAEGDENGGAYKVAEKIKEKFPQFDMRVSILGHMQRGGSPTCMDRVNASRMGYSAVNALLSNKSGVMIGIINNKISFTPFAKAVKHIEEPNKELTKMMEILSL